MAPRSLPSQAYLRECFTYNRRTGVLRWRKRPLSHFPDKRTWRMWNTRFAGKISGHIASKRYVNVSLDHTNYLAHRITWKLIKGSEPPAELDHRNHQKTDNQFRNLRKATRAQNQANAKLRSDNSSGFKGVSQRVYISRRTGKPRVTFWAKISFNSIVHHVGVFATAKLAHQEYCKAAKHLNGEFWNPG